METVSGTLSGDYSRNTMQRLPHEHYLEHKNSVESLFKKYYLGPPTRTLGKRHKSIPGHQVKFMNVTEK